MSIHQILKNKTKEHQNIIEQIQTDIDSMRQKLIQLKKQGSSPQQLMVDSAKLMALKDRMMFHKSAAMALKDLETEILEYERQQK